MSRNAMEKLQDGIGPLLTIMTIPQQRTLEGLLDAVGYEHDKALDDVREISKLDGAHLCERYIKDMASNAFLEERDDDAETLRQLASDMMSATEKEIRGE